PKCTTTSNAALLARGSLSLRNCSGQQIARQRWISDRESSMGLGSALPSKFLTRYGCGGHFNAHPIWIAGGISALAVRGFPYFHHGAPAHMLTPSSRGLSHADSEARVSTARKRFAPIREVDELLPELPVAPVPMAASQFLKDVSLQKYEWNV